MKHLLLIAVLGLISHAARADIDYSKVKSCIVKFDQQYKTQARKIETCDSYDIVKYIGVSGTVEMAMAQEIAQKAYFGLKLVNCFYPSTCVFVKN